MAVLPGLCRTWSKTPKTSSLRTRLKFFSVKENDSADGNRWFPLPIDESSDEADDEFECDCEHCSLLRQQNTSSDLTDLRDLGSHYDEAGRLEEMRLGTENELL